jgi:hypothetical protein
MELKPLQRGPRGNRYCGPAVISFVTGLTTDEAALLIRQQSKRSNIRGTYDREVRAALFKCGYLTHPRKMPVGADGVRLYRPTLATWLRAMKSERTAGRVFLVAAGHHWQLITGRRYACGRIGEITSVRDERVKRRARVTSVYEVEERESMGQLLNVAETRKVREMLAAETKIRRRASSSLSAAKRECERKLGPLGFSFERENLGDGIVHIYVNRPAWFDAAEMKETDLLIDDTISHDWDECLHRVVPMFEEWIAELAKRGYGPESRAA